MPLQQSQIPLLTLPKSWCWQLPELNPMLSNTECMERESLTVAGCLHLRSDPLPGRRKGQGENLQLPQVLHRLRHRGDPLIYPLLYQLINES